MMFILLTLACGGYEFDVSGEVDDKPFAPTNAYWGASYIVFTTVDISCDDMWWVQKTNLTGEVPPIEKDMRALQITYNNEDDEIVEGTYSVGGEAPIKAEHLTISGEDFSVSKSTEGLLELDQKIENETLIGSFNFAFSDGQISGTFDSIPWCINIKP
jgi:hypothetical protein